MGVNVLGEIEIEAFIVAEVEVEVKIATLNV